MLQEKNELKIQELMKSPEHAPKSSYAICFSGGGVGGG